MAYPTTIGECVDLLYALRAERLTLAKQVTDKKTEEAKLKNHLIDALKEAALEGARGETASLGLTYTTVPRAENWDDIWEFVEANDAHDLMEKRLSATACRERWNEGLEIPGITKFIDVDVSLTRFTKRSK